ncbi:hypothetical protein DYB32_009198, partial [Aphanomyces invadans]
MVKAPAKPASVVGDVVRKTLNLPKTDFPMRANATVREPQLHARTVTELYATQEKERKGVAKTFYLHDGPPFANGSLHTALLLSCRYKLQRGYYVHYVPGWDCHGLPIEIKALEKLKQPRDKDLMRWGILADWSGDKGTRYLTMDPEYEVKQYDVFKQMVKDGLIVQGYKPVYWSPSSGTALAESELEYQDDHISSSAYVRFPVKHSPTVLHQEHVKVVATVWGKDLTGGVFRHPLNGQDSIVLLGDHVTTDAGTGIVHTAPAHGQEDYFAWMAHHAQHHTDNSMTCLVDEKGCYTAEAGADLAGLFVQTHGTEKVLEQLTASNALVSVSNYTHRFPYDWRTKKPILLRATKQWFAKLDSLHALGHELPCLAEANGACERIFYDKDTMEPLLNDVTIAHVQKVMLENGGTDAWWSQPVSTLLAPEYDPAQYVKGTDTLDVWFDSGSSWNAVLPKGVQADIYLEGSDQHRGWFQSSLLTSLAVQRKAPYKNVITHGFILDERGQKMSKSLGNVLVPHDIIEGQPKKKIPPYGVDTLRYWVASTDYTSQVGIGPNTMIKISDHVRKVRNTARFLLANLNDFDPRIDSVAYSDMTSLDQYMLHLLHDLQAEITDGYETFAFNKVQQAIAHFIATDLSAFYMEACKDRLYCEAPADPFRRSAQTVHIRLHRLAQFTNAMVNDVPGSVFLEGWFEPK